MEVTADHVRLVMKGLAKYHAISFGMKDQQPDIFNKLTENLDEVFINRANNTLRFYLNTQSASVFEAVADEPDLLAKVTEFYEREAVDWAAECIDTDKTGPASVISYGDCWQHNIMSVMTAQTLVSTQNELQKFNISLFGYFHSGSNIAAMENRLRRNFWIFKQFDIARRSLILHFSSSAVQQKSSAMCIMMNFCRSTMTPCLHTSESMFDSKFVNLHVNFR